MSYKIVQKREDPSNLQKHHSVPTKETLFSNSKRIPQQQNSKFSTSPVTKANKKGKVFPLQAYGAQRVLEG
jgi:hypothetical protein